MIKLLPPLALTFAFALATACSGSDPGVSYTTHGQGNGGHGGGGGSGGGGGKNNGGGGGGGGGNPSPPPPDFDAGTPPGSADYDASRPSSDASTQPDTAPPPQSPLGSCGNPRCGSFGNGGDCGCIARDGNGVQIQLGCNGAQGICACFSQGAQTTDVIDAPNVCDQGGDPASVFIANCGCQ